MWCTFHWNLWEPHHTFTKNTFRVFFFLHFWGHVTLKKKWWWLYSYTYAPCTSMVCSMFHSVWLPPLPSLYVAPAAPNFQFNFWSAPSPPHTFRVVHRSFLSRPVFLAPPPSAVPFVMMGQKMMCSAVPLHHPPEHLSRERSLVAEMEVERGTVCVGICLLRKRELGWVSLDSNIMRGGNTL